MGNNCSSELRDLNLCQLSSCVPRHLHVVPQGLSDLFYLNIHSKIGVAKVCVNANSFVENKDVVMQFLTPAHQTDDYYHFLHRQLQGLEYEAVVYGTIINPLIHDKASLFFHKAYGVTYNCEYQNLYNLFATPPQYNRFKDIIIKHNIVEQFNNPARGNIIDNLKNLTKSMAETLKQKDPLLDLGFNVLLLDKDVSFTKALQGALESPINNTTLFILMQVALACYALECSHLAHNNLSLSSITADELTSKSILYQVGDKVYNIPTPFRIIINDFSQAYSPRLGHNSKSPTDVCCKGRDFLCFMKHFYTNHRIPAEKQKLLGILAPNLESARQLLALFNSPEPLPFPPGGFLEMRSLEDMIATFAQVLNKVVTVTPLVKKVDYALRCEERAAMAAAPSKTVSSRVLDLKEQVEYLQKNLSKLRSSINQKQTQLLANVKKRQREVFENIENEGPFKKRRQLEK